MINKELFNHLINIFNDYCEENGIDIDSLEIQGRSYDPINNILYLQRQREDQKGLSVRELIANDLPMPVSFEISANGVIDRRNEPEKIY